MAIAQAQFETLLGVTFTGTPVLPHYQRGDVVWKKSDYTGKTTWQGTQSYTVVSIDLESFNDAGTERFADSTGTTEVSNAGTQPGDTTTGWYYVVQNNNSQVLSTVHESNLLDEAGIETYLGTQVSTFVS